MIGILTSLALGAGVPQRLAKAAGIIAAVMALAAVLGILLAVYDRSVIAGHEAKITAEGAPRLIEAAGAAADQRAADIIATHQTQEDLNHAVSMLPDARPSDRRRALGCERLRRAGRPADQLPAECRSQGRAEARAQR